MKFYKEHQESIYRLLHQNGMTREDVHFVKRKGRIIIHLRDKPNTFSYFLKKDVSLDETTGGFVDTSYFEVKVNQSPIQKCSNWEDTEALIGKWLSGLDST